MKRLFVAAAIMVIASSCYPYSGSSSVFNYSESSARVLDGSSSFVITPIISDLDVIAHNKITHQEREAFADMIVTSEVVKNIMVYKSIALSKAAKAAGADIIVAAEITVETINQRLVITVTGYPAKYTNFRNATEQDIRLVKEAISINRDEAIIITAPQEEFIEEW